ncbi:hypothetical protein EJB05_06989 [Eragrostis curvula]|uniref:Uncharacterized protein n=1 Tax=Eragrostis curvula TaxID=38414 RepID=A0A5J9WGF7_9POAL|nr:hypothetical protein EJB05_06989 [Eragrostis curvula]
MRPTTTALKQVRTKAAAVADTSVGLAFSSTSLSPQALPQPQILSRAALDAVVATRELWRLLELH